MLRKAGSVDEYILAAPKGVQGKLRQIREAIKSAAPAVTEGISYGMPYYSYRGRLAYFAVHRAHIGFYIAPPVIEEHRKELAAYELARGTVRFPLDEPLPTRLIVKLVMARVKLNESRALRLKK